MGYELYNPDDWIFDPSYRNWVLHPTASADRFWQQYMAAHPAQREAMAQARILILYSQQLPDLPAEQLDHSWETLRNRLPAPIIQPLFPRMWLSFAATALLVFVAGLLFWLHHNRLENYRTAYGEIRSISLPDGSRVTLNANSSLRLTRHWEAGAAREVWLEGEAFFSVKHLQNHQKFVVHARQLDVQVLGTEFNVFTRPKAVKVALESGSVNLSQPSKPSGQFLRMKPGQLFEVKADGTQQWRRIQPKQHSVWKENRLVLDQTTLADLVDMLRDSYGLEVHVPQTELLGLQASGSMPLTSADEVLVQISRLFSLTISRSGSQITIKRI